MEASVRIFFSTSSQKLLLEKFHCENLCHLPTWVRYLQYLSTVRKIWKKNRNLNSTIQVINCYCYKTWLEFGECCLFLSLKNLYIYFNSQEYFNINYCLVRKVGTLPSDIKTFINKNPPNSAECRTESSSYHPYTASQRSLQLI